MTSAGPPDLVVIGAGALGAATAWFATRAGLSVTGVERGPIVSGSTSACEGNLLVSDKEAGQSLRFIPTMPIMKVGWSDGGQASLRATNAERYQVLRLLEIGHAEGRLDSADHAWRVDAVQTATTRGELAALAADLPNRPGVREWLDQIRVHGDDRDRAVRWLAEAAAQGRLTASEHELRLAALTEVDSYAALRAVLRGVPGRPGAVDDDVLASAVDREAALTELAEAVTDGRLTPAEYPSWEAELRQTRQVRQLRELLHRVAARPSDHERGDAAARLNGAYSEGRLDAAQLAERVGKVRAAATSTDLSALVQDSQQLLGTADREAITARLRQALDDGRLDLAAYESRLRAAYEATTAGDAQPLFADLLIPPRPARRGPLDRIFDYWVLNSALLPEPVRWWQRLVPKPAWKALNVGTIVVSAWLTARYIGHPVAQIVLLAGGWFPIIVLLVGWGLLARLTARGAARCHRDLLAGLQATIAGLDPGIEEVEITHTLGSVEIGIRLQNGPGPIPPQVVDETLRLLWCSRVYPLAHVEINSGWPGRDAHRVKLNRGERARLRHRYGPRPYGPIPNTAG